MPRSTWVFAGILSGLVLLGITGMGWRRASQEAERAQAEAADARHAAEQLASTTNQLSDALATAKAEAEALETKIKEAREDRLGLEQQMRAELDSKDVTISQLQGRLTLSIVDRVLFDSGQTLLKPEGEAILLKIAKFLGSVTNREVQVVGHTDNVPIHSRTIDGFTDNWALSSGRAVAAVRFLQEKGGVDPKRLSAVGCGEYRPLAGNDSNEGRAKNRRIAVVVLPEQMGPDDTAHKTETASTNLPPVKAESQGANAAAAKQ